MVFKKYMILFIVLTLLQVSAIAKGRVDPKKVVLTGNFHTKVVPDALKIMIWNHTLATEQRTLIPHVELNVPVKNGHFVVELPSMTSINFYSIGWFSLWGKTVEQLTLFPIEKDGSLNIDIFDQPFDSSGLSLEADDHVKHPLGQFREYSFTFSGKQGILAKCKYELEKSYYKSSESWEKEYKPSVEENEDKTIMARVTRPINWMKYVTERQLSILSSYRKELSENAYLLLRSELIGNALYNVERALYNTISLPGFEKKVEHDRDRISQYVETSDSLASSIPPKILINSPAYTQFQLYRVSTLKILLKTEQAEIIKSRYTGIFREHLWVSNVLYRYWRWSSELQGSILNESQQIVKGPWYRNFLKTSFSRNAKGQRIEFSLLDTANKVVTMNEFKSKVVFMDFWFVGCTGCSLYYKQVVSKVEEKFKGNQEVVFLTVSVDANKKTWLRGINSGDYTSPSVVNLYSKFGANDKLVKQLNINIFPHPLLLDRNGKIFSDSNEELRIRGIEGLSAKIAEALSKKSEL